MKRRFFKKPKVGSLKDWISKKNKSQNMNINKKEAITTDPIEF